jgi:hypothetical protein
MHVRTMLGLGIKQDEKEAKLRRSEKFEREERGAPLSS